MEEILSARMGWEDRRSGNQDRGDRDRDGIGGRSFTQAWVMGRVAVPSVVIIVIIILTIMIITTMLSMMIGGYLTQGWCSRRSWEGLHCEHPPQREADFASRGRTFPSRRLIHFHFLFLSSDLSSFLRKASAGFPLQCEIYTDFENFF